MKKKRIIYLLILVMVLIGCSLGGSPASQSTSTSCTVNSDCSAGQICQNGSCTTINNVTLNTPSNLTATVISCQEVDLSWSSVNGATGYYIFRNSNKLGSSTTVTYNDTSTSENASYSYTVQAYNSTGTSQVTAPVQVTTPACSTSGPPSTPSAPSTSSPTCSSLVVSWSGVTGASSYKLFRNGTQIATPSSSPYADTGLSANTTYSYTVEACNSGGCSSQSASGSGSTTGIPGIPSAPSTSSPTCSSLVVSWGGVTGASSYKLFRNGTQIATPSSSPYTDSGLTANTTYSYSIEGCNSCGCSSQSASGSGSTTGIPGIPSAPSTSSPTCSSLVVSWSGVTGASSYKLFRNGTQIATPSSSPYADTGLNGSTSYSYTIEACNSCGCSSLSSAGIGSTTGVPGTPFTPIVGSPTCNSLNISWNGVTGASNYLLDRDGSQIANTSNTFYSDSGLGQNTTHSYTVAACNSCGCSSNSGAASGTTSGTPGTPGTPSASPSCSTVNLSWSSVSGASSYNVYRNGSQIGSTSSTSYSDSGLSNNTTYTYSISACSSCGCSSQSGGKSVTTSCTPTERITNGSFSSGTSGWTLVGDFWAGTNLPNYRTSPGYAAGGVDSTGVPKNSAYGYMYQDVPIPSNATSATLSFWYNVTSQDSTTTPYDVLSLFIEDTSGNILATAATLSNVNQTTLGFYQQASYNVTSYKGQTIRIFFLATTDASYTSTFRIDDVSLMSDGN